MKIVSSPRESLTRAIQFGLLVIGNQTHMHGRFGRLRADHLGPQNAIANGTGVARLHLDEFVKERLRHPHMDSITRWVVCVCRPG